MKLKIKDYFIMTFICLTPFCMLLLSLKLSTKKILNSNLYNYLIIGLLFILFITFIISIFYIMNDILYNSLSRKRRLICLLLTLFLNIIYIPIYYTKNILKNERNLGIVISISNLILIVLFSYSVRLSVNRYLSKADMDSIIISDKFGYISLDKTFTISLNTSYVCDDSGDYVVSCDSVKENNFIGIYNYVYGNYSKKELENIYKYHLNQTKEYIEEAKYNYSYNVNDGIGIFNYDNDLGQVLIKKVDYDIDNDNKSDYSLIVIKEGAYSDDLISFNSLINSIKFIE